MVFLDQRLGDLVDRQALLLNENAGTHRDAPGHVLPRGTAVDGLPSLAGLAGQAAALLVCVQPVQNGHIMEEKTACAPGGTTTYVTK